jgi:hypothetical protein
MRRILKALRLVHKASPYRNVFRQIIDIFLTKIRVNISPAEYYSFELYKGDKTWEEKGRYIGKFGSLYWPYELNRLKFNATLTNKYIQKNLLMGFGLPTPRMITTIGQNFAIETLEELREFLSGNKQDIVLKPASSRGGHNVLVLECRDQRYYMAGEQYTAERIWDHTKPNLDKGILVEERVSNNRQIEAFYPHSLNCFRVATIKLENRWQLVFPPYLKVGHGGSVVDNLMHRGGILLFLDDDGTSQMAYAEHLVQKITHHPDTGASLVGIRMEGVDKVRELGLEASRKFGFLGTIGWDIGLTENGPVIIEGNTLWGGLKDQNLLGGFVSDEMARCLKKHTLFTRWDRTRMFPRFYEKLKAFRT